MSADRRVLAEMDCFHTYYRFRQAWQPESVDLTQYEAWLDYRQAILRREEQRCSQCGQIRAATHLDVRPRRPLNGPERLAPDNLICVCLFCVDNMVTSRSGRARSRLS